MDVVRIDGSFGEGGGQVLRTSLALSALTGRPVTVSRIRANRTKPGLRPQHLTSVRAAAALCSATVQGGSLNSQQLDFRPGGPLQGGEYRFDVRDAAHGGSAGALTLVVQAILLPLAFATRPSRVSLHGGTHVPWSPPFHYLQDVFLPALHRMGLPAEARLKTWGWYPAGQGELELEVETVGQLRGMEWMEQGEPVRVAGVAAVTNLPAHIPQRMANRANNLLRGAGLNSQVQAARERGPAPGAGIFLTAEYEHGVVGFGALGRQGRPSEQVADEACQALLDHHRSGAAVDPHLADQLILPLALAAGTSCFTTSEVTSHTMTNLHVVQQFLEVEVQAEPSGVIRIKGIGFHV